MKKMTEGLRKFTATGLSLTIAFCLGLITIPVADVFADILEPEEPQMIVSEVYKLNDTTPCGGNIDPFLDELEAEQQAELEAMEPPVEPEPVVDIEAIKYDPNTDIHTLIMIVSEEIGLDWRVLEGLVYAESSFNPECGRGRKYVGLCQVSKTNYNNLKGVLGLSDNYFEPYSNLKCGAYIYQCLLIKYQDYHKALVCYNMGEGGAKGIWESAYSRKVINYARGLGFDREV